MTGCGTRTSTDTDSRTAASLRAHGLSQFETGDFGRARETLTNAIAHGAHDTEAVTVLAGIIEDEGDDAALAELYTNLLDRHGPFERPIVILDWERQRFDAVRSATNVSPRQLATVALDLLSAAAAAGDWHAILERRDVLDSIFAAPADRLDLLEQFSYAPPVSGLPASAAAEIEALGHRHATDESLARTAERLLHGLRRPNAAYGVERARRLAAGARRPERGRTDEAEDFGGATILIAGGHPPLRRMVSVDFKRSGATSIHEVPSKWEAVQSGRSVQDRMAGSDLAVLIGRQLAHSTADQVRTAAARYDVPLARAETAGVASIRRAALGARR